MAVGGAFEYRTEAPQSQTQMVYDSAGLWK